MASLKWSPKDVPDDQPRARGAAARARAKEMRKVAEARRIERQQRNEQRRLEAKHSRKHVGLPAEPPLSIPAIEAEDEIGERCARNARERRPGSEVAAGAMSGDGVAEELAQATSRLCLSDILPAELWLCVLGHLKALDLSACACVCKSFASVVRTPELWYALHAHVFGIQARSSCPHAWLTREGAHGPRVQESDVPSPPWFQEPAEASREESIESAADGSDTTATLAEETGSHSATGSLSHTSWDILRQRLVASEHELHRWAYPSAPTALPLPGMLDATLDGAIGASVHEGGIIRLWHAPSARRLAASKKLRHTPTCIHAAASVVAAGDSSGRVNIFSTEEGLHTISLPPLERVYPSAALAGALGECTSVLLHPLHPSAFSEADRAGIERYVVVSGASQGDVDAWSLSRRAFDDSAPSGASGGWESEWEWGLRGEMLDFANPSGVAWRGPVGLAVKIADEGVFATSIGGVARLVDLERGSTKWKGEALGLSDDEELALATPYHGPPPPRRLASYSSGWRVLAAVTGSNRIALFDERMRTAIATCILPCSEPPAFVHLEGGGVDRRLPGGTFAAPPGYMLLSGSGGQGIYIYDVRKLSRDDLCLSSSSRSPPPLVAPLQAPAGMRLSGCFAAGPRWLVAACKPKSCAAALCWDMRDAYTENMLHGEDGSSERTVQAGNDVGDGCIVREKTRQKPRRQAKEQRRLPCRLANR